MMYQVLREAVYCRLPYKYLVMSRTAFAKTKFHDADNMHTERGLGNASTLVDALGKEKPLLERAGKES
jgi:hypothetical protein